MVAHRSFLHKGPILYVNPAMLSSATLFLNETPESLEMHVYYLCSYTQLRISTPPHQDVSDTHSRKWISDSCSLQKEHALQRGLRLQSCKVIL